MGTKPLWMHAVGKADLAEGFAMGWEEVNHRAGWKRPLGKRCCWLTSGCFSAELS